MTRLQLRLLTCGALTVGAALLLAPVITQELWTADLLTPVLVVALLALYPVTALAIAAKPTPPWPRLIPPQPPTP